VKIHPNRILFAVAMSASASTSMGGAIEYKDPLDLAVAAPETSAAAQQRIDRLILYAGDTFAYDNNIYRLPASVTDLTPLPGIGSNPSREDLICAPTTTDTFEIPISTMYQAATA